MKGEIEILVESRGNPPRFRLLRRDGGVPAVASVLVADAATLAPVWCIAAERYQAVVGIQFVEVQTDGRDADPPAEAWPMDPIEDLPPSDPRHQRALLEPMDPVEDLPPSDPRHQAALRRMSIDETTLLGALDAVTYGVVPERFVQVHPADRSVPPLKPKRAYSLTADTLGDYDAVQFEVE